MQHHGDDPDDHHVHCLDLYMLPHQYEYGHRKASGAMDVLCRVPVDKGHGRASSASVHIGPGIEVLDLYEHSERSEIWKNGVVCPCIVPEDCIGWEYYSLMWTSPSGASALSCGDGVDLLIGRRPGAPICPSVMFAFIPAGRIYSSGDKKLVGSKKPEDERSPLYLERQCGNLDAKGQTMLPRLVVLSPSITFKEPGQLPEDPNWGLFIGPRSRTLVLCNKQRGRIDLHLAAMFTVDAVFFQSRNLIEATSRLFDVFGTGERVPALFTTMKTSNGDCTGNVDPLKIHNGFTNATMADHISIAADGRQDYVRLFNVRLPTFFISNSSGNLFFLTPQEAARHRNVGHEGGASRLPKIHPLPDIPIWTLNGHSNQDTQILLRSYRGRVPLRDVTGKAHETDHSWLSTILGLDSQGVSGWLSSLGPSACSDLKKAGENPTNYVQVQQQPSVAPPPQPAHAASFGAAPPTFGGGLNNMSAPPMAPQVVGTRPAVETAPVIGMQTSSGAPRAVGTPPVSGGLPPRY